MRHRLVIWFGTLAAALTSGGAVQTVVETRTVSNGLDVHETALILRAELPSHLLTNESCANAQAGWTIVPESVIAEVVTARMMDPGGDPDWKVEKAEARARLDNDNTRICLRGYCRGHSNSNARSWSAPVGRSATEPPI